MRLATRFLSELRIRLMADFVLANGLVSPFDNPNHSTESHYTSKFRICPMPRMKRVRRNTRSGDFTRACLHRLSQSLFGEIRLHCAISPGNLGAKIHYQCGFLTLLCMKVCTLAGLCYTELFLQRSGETEDGNPASGRRNAQASGCDDRVSLRWQRWLDV